MTFVKTKLMLERLAPGAIAEVRLRSGEPLDNVPRSVKEDGHEVLSWGLKSLKRELRVWK